MKMSARRSILTLAAGLAASLILLQSGHALAGPEEDYTQGAKMYANGDMVGALPLLRRSAEAGHAAAQAIMGDLHLQADEDQEALPYFQKSAAQGNANGQFGLATMLASGTGVPKNLDEARSLLVKAAEQGHPIAISELALAYINGGLNIPENSRNGADALRWISAAAKNGQRNAMEKLAAAYRTGELGLAVDAALAQQWADKVKKASGARQGRRNKKSDEK